MGELVHAEKHVLDLPLEVKADGEPGVFEGYGAIFGNLDRDGDIVAKGAFSASLQGRLPALLWQHNAKEPIGKFDEVREDEKGLYVRGRLSLQGRGREAYELLKMGALDGLSIGFVTKEASKNALTGARTIKRAELMEISLVTFPANEMARVANVKSTVSVPDNPRAFERFLRDQGFSRTRAKAIIAKGFDSGARENMGDVRALVSHVQDRRTDLEEKVAILTRLLQGGRAAAIDKALGNLTRAYKALRPTPMPIHIFPGRSARFSLGMRRLSGNQTVYVNNGYDKESSRTFDVRIEYWQWTTDGPIKESIEGNITSGDYNNKIDTMEFGDIRNLEIWLGKEWDTLEARNALDRFDSVVSRISRVISSGLAPKGVINFKSYGVPVMRIDPPGRSRKKEFPFVVR